LIAYRLRNLRFDPDQCAQAETEQRLVRWVATGRFVMEWQPVSTAPFDRDLELAVIGYHGPHALAFPCRRILGGWVNAKSKKRIDVRPTHWRDWSDPD
jgi:hypothetical protein